MENTIDRIELQPFVGQTVRVRGRVQNVTAPTKYRKLVCVQNVYVTSVDNNTSFDDAPTTRLDHAWIDVTGTTGEKAMVGQKLEGVVEVTLYTRKDKTKSFGLRLADKALTERSFIRQIFERLAYIDALGATMEQRAQLVQQLSAMIAEELDNNRVILFKRTKAEVAHMFQKHWLMRSVGVHTLNREGRRRYRQSRQRSVKQSLSLGFA